MARFDTTGIDDIINELQRERQDVGELADQMVTAAVEEIAYAWKQSAQMHGLRDTGAMIESIGFDRSNVRASDVIYNDVYPQGTDSKGVRNAEKAFILHYGKRSFPATYWVDDADEMSAEPVYARIREIWENRK